MKCKCGYVYWANCHEAWHKDKTWEQMKDEGIAKLQNKAIIKTCPKCKSNIEKNRGWNNMTCGVCGEKFNWETEEDEKREEDEYDF